MEISFTIPLRERDRDKLNENIVEENKFKSWSVMVGVLCTYMQSKVLQKISNREKSLEVDMYKVAKKLHGDIGFK